MKEELAKYIAPREERLTFGGVKLVVRELGTAADGLAFKTSGDTEQKFIVRCVFIDETGEPAFSDEDIPALKLASRLKMLPVIEAVNRVMGFDLAEEVKNSAAAPSAG